MIIDNKFFENYIMECKCDIRIFKTNLLVSKPIKWPSIWKFYKTSIHECIFLKF